ncbi:MAG TPA: hypothetical protein VNN77_10680 [candidate division Zixibacteria bacterium]|nr:hypothetical protein [candidate division Zixibacteria bacterium]
MGNGDRDIFSFSGTVTAVLLLLAFMGLSYSAALQKSPTFDEPLHLYAGYSHLRWGDFRVNPEHPPLAKILAALPLLATGVDASSITARERDRVQVKKRYGWNLADRFFLANARTPGFIAYPKLVMICLAAGLGILVFLCARDLYGELAALAALSLYCLDPNITAHSSIIHTDVPFALFFFAGTYAFWRASCRLTWPNLLGTALCFALAAVTKFSFLVILPVWALLGVVLALSPQPQYSEITSPRVLTSAWHKIALVLAAVALAVFAAYGAIWAVHGLRFDAVGGQTGRLRIGLLATEESWLGTVALLNARYLLIPEAWLYGLLDATRRFDRPSYLLGAVSEHGSWLYFPVAFLVKTPVPVLAAIAISVVLSPFRRLRPSRDDLFLLIPALVFFSAAAGSKLNIGLRHILPVYPFLFVFLGGRVAVLWSCGSRWARWALLFLAAWLLAGWVKTYPDYLAFFNELAGGPRNGSRYLVDSNLDWGQDLPGLKRWMDEHKARKIELAYFGTVNPAAYGIDATPLPGSLVFSPWSGNAASEPADYVAISATFLAGLYLPKDFYAGYRAEAPVASIGHSILIFRKK